MISAAEIVSASVSRGYSVFTGVPCSFLKPLINYVIQNDGLEYVTATSEGEAVGIAAGTYLAGRKAVVMCQNSGLGNMINPLSSLTFPFRIPLLVIVTLRGEPGLHDEPQHELMGQITGRLFESLRIPWAPFPDDSDLICSVLERAETEMAKTQRPFALIMKKGSVAKTDLQSSNTALLSRHQAVTEGSLDCHREQWMSRIGAIRTVRATVPKEDAIVATTGKIGRELFTIGDRENQLYVVGSMGCAAGIGFGIQHVRPEQRVIILDGDGAVLMKMGSMGTIGHYGPKRLIHVILDNEAYESTGGQDTVSSSVDFSAVAAACGYQRCYRVDTETDLIRAMEATLESSGPSCVHVKVSPGSAPELGRPTLKPFQVKERFMKFLAREV